MTTYFTIHTADGSRRCEEYDGEFPTSPTLPDDSSACCGSSTLETQNTTRSTACTGATRSCAPIASVASEQTDWLLSAELALIGPIIHVDRRLANRTRSYPVNIDRAAVRRRLDPIRGEELKSSTQRLHRDLLALVMSADLTEEQVRRCKRALRRFSVAEIARRGRARASQARHRLTGDETGWIDAAHGRFLRRSRLLAARSRRGVRLARERDGRWTAAERSVLNRRDEARLRGFGRSVHWAKPRLPPVGEDLTWAEPAPVTPLA